MRRRRDAQKEGGHMRTKARDGQCHKLRNACDYQKLEEAKTEIILELKRKHASANIFIFHFQPPEL